jgi:hypothetical protein
VGCDQHDTTLRCDLLCLERIDYRVVNTWVVVKARTEQDASIATHATLLSIHTLALSNDVMPFAAHWPSESDEAVGGRVVIRPVLY